MTSAEYWQRLPPFDYVTTYSFNRGPKLQGLLQAAEQEKQVLRRQLLTSSGAQLLQLRAAIRCCEAVGPELLGSLLTSGLTTYNPTATPVSTLDVATVAKIGALLGRPVLQRFDWMCSPVYRDALAFHAADSRLLGVLNICFACDRLVTGAGKEVEADATVYQELKILLQRLGHRITDNHAG